MSRLSDAIRQVVEEERSPSGVLDVHCAAKKLLGRLDDEEKDQLATEAACKRLKDAAAKGARADATALQAGTNQLPLFPDLRRGYALDIEGRVVKSTESLTRLEFGRICAMREKQIKDDTAHLEVLRAALKAASPLWDQHPDKTFGEICEMLGGVEERRAS